MRDVLFLKIILINTTAGAIISLFNANKFHHCIT